MGLSWAKIGVKCVCVNDDPTTMSGRRELVSGSVYTIRWVGPLNHPTQGMIPVSVRLEGIVRYGNPDGCPFNLDRFRPLVSLEDDISMFTALTNMSPVERLDRLKEMMDQ